MKRYQLLAWGGFALTTIVGVGAIALMLVPIQGSPLDPVDLLSDVTAILQALMIAVVSAVVAVNLRKNPIGWVLLSAGLTLAIKSWLDTYTLIAFSTGIETLRGGIAAAWVSEWLWIIPVCALVMFLHLFPTGTFLSPRWRWVALVSIILFAAVVVPLAFSLQLSVTSTRGELFLVNPVGLFAFPNWVYPLIFLPIFAALVGALSSIVLRFMRAHGGERQQIKWILYAAAIFVGSILLTFYETAPVYQILVNVIALGIPLAIGIAILRYRLFDIDILIRRTVTYALVVGLLLVVYFGSVIVLQQIFANLTGVKGSEIVTVLSTLAIAALFVPLRNRIQNEIDKRFNRKKYNAQQVLTDFANTVRDETDLEKLSARLMQVVDDTMQPKSQSLWLKREEKSRR